MQVALIRDGSRLVRNEEQKRDDIPRAHAQRRALLWFFLGGLTKKEPGGRPEPAKLLLKMVNSDKNEDKQMQKNTRLVYSDSLGKICPNCQQAIGSCRCQQQEKVKTGDGIVRISRETKGRKGKGVTLVSGVPLDATGLKALARELKQLCGTGGTLKEGVIEIQGDQRDKLLPVLQNKGWKVKLAGG